MKNGFVSFRTPANCKARQGFTLTELLLVIIIMAILAAMSITVQRSAVESTRRERTIVTIRKIDAALTSAYEKYQYRKPDVSFFISNIKEALESDNAFRLLPEEEQKTLLYRYVLQMLYRSWAEWIERSFYAGRDDEITVDKQFAPYILRTIMLRELLLCDFPDSLDEVNYNPLMNDSPVHLAYQSQLDEAVAKTPGGNILAGAPDGDISADLLYLIIMNTSPETRGSFLDRETADTNNNGIPEFVDGWGNPIRFIRWAPAVPETKPVNTAIQNIFPELCEKFRAAAAGTISSAVTSRTPTAFTQKITTRASRATCRYSYNAT